MHSELNLDDVTIKPWHLLRIKEVMKLTGLSRSYIYTLAADGRFPKSISLVPGGTSRAWIYAEVQEWIWERIEERNQEVH